MSSYNMRLLPKKHRKKYRNYIPITYDCINSIPCVDVFIERDDNFKLQNYHKELLYKAMSRQDGLKYGEVAMLVSLYTGESILVYGEFDTVKISCDDKWKNMLKRYGTGTLVSIHNHPYGGTFSAGDISVLVDTDAIDLITVVSNDGKHIYILEKISDCSKVISYINAEANKLPRQHKDDTIDLKIRRDKAAIKLLNQAKNKEFLGLIYSESIKV